MTLDNRLWAVITAIVCIATLILGWFVGVEPRLAAVARAAAQQLIVEEQNRLARSDIATMQKAAEEMDTLEAALAELRRIVPPGVDGTGFIKTVDSLVVGNGVTLAAVLFDQPVPYVAPPEGDPLAPLSDPIITEDNFVVVPVAVSVVGGNEQVLSFLAALQSSQRLFSVTSVSKNQSEPGIDVFELTVGGFIYVLRDPIAEAAFAGESVPTADPAAPAPPAEG
ncbi:hypothetical protein [Salinibacterium sp. ZJ77]|uniref:hypothetical protein n=1 Tax=Salinibacterium sp. ZJ77 TaxID=2708337 RepID=UPI0014210E24|nr:hypothetical protein [Salinibacterium sp. ZJ77]